MTQVDMQLRSEVLASAPAFQAAASEPIWSEWAEPTQTGAQLVFYVSDRSGHFGTLGGFWMHALFNFLEDRLDSSKLAACAMASMCRKTTGSEVVKAIEARLGRPLEETERVAMHLAEHQKNSRVFDMLASDSCLAALVEDEGMCIGAFVAKSAEGPGELRPHAR